MHSHIEDIAKCGYLQCTKLYRVLAIRSMYMHLNTYFFNFVLYLLAYTLQLNMSRDLWFPMMWHFDKCRLRACAAFFKPRNSKWCLASSIGVIEYSSD